MNQWAAASGAVICGSLIIREDGRFFNRLIWMKPDGKFQFYDKRHLFTLAGEEKVFTAGTKRLLVEYKGWRICPLICYDLRFPVWSRNTEKYDLLFYIANWPEKRIEAWDILLKARAVENLTYVIGLNRVGTDGNNIYYSGNSSIIDPLGRLLEEKQHDEAIITTTLSLNEVRRARQRFAFLNDRDHFEIKTTDKHV
jgi:predicted amidohydrolase